MVTADPSKSSVDSNLKHESAEGVLENSSTGLALPRRSSLLGTKDSAQSNVLTNTKCSECSIGFSNSFSKICSKCSDLKRASKYSMNLPALKQKEGSDSSSDEEKANIYFYSSDSEGLLNIPEPVPLSVDPPRVTRSPDKSSSSSDETEFNNTVSDYEHDAIESMVKIKEDSNDTVISLPSSKNISYTL